jgi:hypothetical protein
MKRTVLISFVFSLFVIKTFAQENDQRLIIITTDGFRWHEVYKGMDEEIASDKRYNQGDSLTLFKTYGGKSPEAKRQKLLPFFWGTIAKQGQLFGNRNLGNKVDNANPYWFSYPGYSEIMTGQVDTLINSNDYMPNPHSTILEFFNSKPSYKGKVAAFGAWGAFDRILNETRAGFPVINAFDDPTFASNDSHMKLIAAMLRDSHKPFGTGECLDVFTHHAAMNYLQTKRPKVLYISYGETDEFAHEAKYKFYLEAAHQFDAWVGEIWNWIQSQPDYKGKTTLLITTDHGRGNIEKNKWTSHGQSISDAHEIWFAVMGPKVSPLGEIKTPAQYYQKQLAQTAAKLVGTKFECEHEVAEGVDVR